MIVVEGYKAFRGTMKIFSCIDKSKFYELKGDWLYKPHTNCWCGCGRSFSANICEIVEDKNAEG